MKQRLLLSSYFVVLLSLYILSCLGKFLLTSSAITIFAGLVITAVLLFFSYILLKYIPKVNLLPWLPLLALLANIPIQITGGFPLSAFSIVYFFLIPVIVLITGKKGAIFFLIFVLVAEIASAFFTKRINLNFGVSISVLIFLAIMIGYFLENSKKKLQELEEKLKGIEKSTSVLSTPANTTDRTEVLTTLKSKVGNSDIKAREKMTQLIEPIINVIYETIQPFSAVIFLKEEKKDSFFLFLYRSHSAYINNKAVITGKTGTYNWVIKEKQPLINNQFLLDARLLEYYTKDENIRSIIILPLLEESELLGFTICDSKKENGFTWHDKEKLKVFGNLIISTLSLFKSLYWAQWDANRYSALHEIAKRLSQSLHKDTVSNILIELAPQICDFDLLVLILSDDSGKPFVYKLSPDKDNYNLKNSKILIDGSLAGLVFQNNQLLIKSRKIKTPFFTKQEKGLTEFQSFFGVPLHKDDRAIGELVLLSKKISAFSLKKKAPVIFLADLFSVALEKANLYQKTKELSITDGLTGAFNHKHFQKKLKKEIWRAKRSGNPFSLLMFDIDHFKKFNDNYGHQIGDEVLKHISGIVKKNLRKIDIFARYGGEEFVIILPETSKQGALVAAEKTRLLIEKKPLIIKDDIYPVTVSIGCATFPEDGEDNNALIKKADEALYRAKQDGRNCVR